MTAPLPTDTLHARATRTAMMKLLPLICVVYFMSYIDRTNVSLAKTQLAADVGISAAAFGLGAGIFFISYAFLEVPSNLVMYRVGARAWITRIALTWGALSALMMFVQGEVSFYVLRFLLGAAEAGLFPALAYMVTVWFAQEHRARVMGLIYLAPTVALIIGGPLGGALMELDTLYGLRGWQWMFLIEGLVTMVVGVIVWFLLPSTPHRARWLTTEEADVLTERAGRPDRHDAHIRGNLRRTFGRPFILVIAVIYFLNQVSSLGLVFNVPSIIERMDVSSPFLIGLISGSVGIGATVGVLVLPRLVRGARYEATWVGLSALGTLVTSVGYLMIDAPVARVVLIAVGALFIFGTLPLFWSIAMARMSGVVAAAGLAFINTIGLIGGFVGPYLFGLAEQTTGDPASGFVIVIAVSAISVVLSVVLVAALRREDRAPVGGAAPEQEQPDAPREPIDVRRGEA
ncbi:MFS transporter [Tersicoccus solisilvae]|uniref:MFS transporter n=1 Tax=Tersicoccus solisilvae TaxID=1882339 RepID=A0ABQ1P5Q9_9MICC|nr:MFS transporter [Tersicoccus solisilvae]GGC89651.1 MFS transporter [Tersicoccus solisilvae]